MSDAELIERLTAVTTQIMDQPELLAEWAHDWWPYTAKLDANEETLPTVAVIPDSVAEVSAVVRVAVEAGRPINLKGGGTNLSGAIEPRAGAILIDLRGLNVIDAVDPVNCTVRVDAGVHGGELEDRLNEQGYTLGHYPRSLHLSTVGGWVAMRSAGSFATKYGGIAEMTLGLDVVLASGEIVLSRPIPLRTAGPNWIDLFAGSEGSFGIVTGATLRVHPAPEERRFRAFDMPDFAAALEQIRILVQAGVIPGAVCLYDTVETAALGEALGVDRARNLLVLAFDGAGAMVDAQENLFRTALEDVGGKELGAGPAAAWFERRYNCEWIVDGNEFEGSMADEIDVRVPWSALPAVVDIVRGEIDPFAREVRVRSEHVFATGLSLCFSFFITEPGEDIALEAYQRAWSAAMRAVIDAGGSIAHHGGIGQARAPWLEEELGGGTSISRSIKQALDPTGRLNPGRLTF